MNAIAMPLFGQDLTDPPRLPGRPAELPGPQKAAVIVRLAIAGGLQLPLKSLPETMQGSLTEEMAALSTIDRATVTSVVEEFIARIEAIGLSFPSGIEGALALLDGQISEDTMARLRRRAGRKGGLGDPWARLSGIDADRLLGVIGDEAPEVAAVALSKLAVAKAAEILGKLPGEQARRIAFTMSQTGSVDPDTVERIGRAIAETFETEPVKAFADGPVERVGAILNFSPASTRESVLQGLEETDAAFADQVRKAIFTFTNIPARIEPRDISRIVRGVEQAQLVTAIAGARGEDQKAAEFILANISQRLAASIREEAAAKGAVKEKDAEAAMGAIVAAVRELEAAGEIFLIAGEEE
ncbi:MAG: flagellar motor switch protein FliG [Paracoccaceae bacterium]